MAERVLDIVSEHPEKQHVEGEMCPVGMQELMGDERERGRHARDADRYLQPIEKACRDDGIARHRIEPLAVPDSQLADENQRVDKDQGDRDVMRADIEARVGIVEGNQRHGICNACVRSLVPIPGSIGV